MDQTVQPAVETHVGADPADLSDAALDAALREEPEAPAAAAETPAEEVHEEPRQEKTVDIRALHEERMRRKNAESENRRIVAENQQMRDQWVRAQARLDALAARQNEQEAPDPNTQPLEALAHNQQMTVQQVKALNERLDQQNLANQQAAEADRAARETMQQVEEFRQTTPDYHDALNYAIQTKKNEFLAMGYTDQQINAWFGQYAAAVQHQARQQQRNPAEIVYEAARAIGYMPPAKKLEMQAEGMKAAKPSGGAGGKGKLTLDALAKMSDEEFDAETKGDRWKKMWQ